MNLRGRILNLLARLKPQPRLPKAGETWYMVDGSPWPMKTDEGEEVSAQIVDCQEGWVCYRAFCGAPEAREPLKVFLAGFHHEPVRLR